MRLILQFSQSGGRALFGKVWIGEHMTDGIVEGAGLSYRSTPWARLKRLLFGAPLSTSVQFHHRLPIFLALPVFASDALSSVAYGTEEILIVLAAAYTYAGGPAALGYQIPISVGIAVLMLIVATSYRRAIHLYPTSGGSYTVSRRNLGATAGLVAGAALMIDYILTVAVSVSAGVAALTSYFQDLHPYRVALAVLLVIFIAFINLRGVRESGWWFAVPAYSFIAMIALLIVSSLVHYFTGTVQQVLALPDAIKPEHGLQLFVILRAFSNGCSAMTGVEAVSNGVSAFQPPEAKNAAKTLLILILLLIAMFLGVGFAANVYHVVPTHSETVLTQLARANFGSGIITALIAYTTLAILMVAANTSFAGFPRVLALMAGDGYAPRQFSSLGDRLVYNRGILALTAISLALIIMFRATVNSLIPLYAVGVFLCFTLSQSGMVRKLLKTRQPGFMHSLIINLVGAVVTGAVTLIVATSKFTQGAWVVVVLIPLIVWFARAIKKHYLWFERTLAAYQDDYNPLRHSSMPLTVVVLVSGAIHRGTLEGIECARDLAGGNPHSQLRALHIELDPVRTPWLIDRWHTMVEEPLHGKFRLDVVHSPFRWLAEPVLEYLDKMNEERMGDRIIVVIPEFETGSWWTRLLHNASGRRLREILLMRPNVTVVTSRFFLRKPPLPPETGIPGGTE